MGPDAAFGAAGRWLEDAFPGASVAVGYYRGDRQELNLLHTRGETAAAFLRRIGAPGLKAQQYADDPAWCVVAPLVAGGRTLGAMAVSRLADRFRAVEGALLDAAAGVMGAAIGRAVAAQRALNAHRIWSQTVDALPLPLCRIAANGMVLRANLAFCRLVGKPVIALRGHPLLDAVPVEWRDTLAPLLDGGDSDVQVTVGTSLRSLVVTGYPVGDPGAPETVILFDDQTERQRLQAQLIQSEKMSAIGQLIAGIAHDLNNPLASVVGFADFLMEAGPLPDHMQEPLSVIQQEAERAAKVVKNLLRFARRHEGQRRPTAVPRLVQTTAELLRNELSSHQVTLRIRLDEDLPILSVEPNQIQQVLVNLLTNALQAIASTGQPGSITVRARRWTDGVALDVIDDGPGVPPETGARIFEPFYTTKPEGSGTGLGLSISQGIIREHGGQIVLGNPAYGAWFTIELPGAAPDATDDSPPTIHPPAEPLRVLVVDDEPHILHYMSATLEAWGHAVRVAGDGESALALATAERFDLVISDLRMPTMNGRELFQRLVERQPALRERIVFTTGDSIRDDTLAFLEQEGRPCLHKPFSLGELRTILAATAVAAPDAP